MERRAEEGGYREEGQGGKNMEKDGGEERKRKKGKREEGKGKKRKRKEERKGKKKEKAEECDLERNRRKGSRGKKMFRGRDYGETDRIVRIRGLEERKGEAEMWMIITEMKEMEDKEEILERGMGGKKEMESRGG